jgi:D-tyrosyl-tRNA(Tyr) deacylase
MAEEKERLTEEIGSTREQWKSEKETKALQDVAVKAIEGASKLGSFGSLVHTLKEQTRKQTGEE